jgi:hypothetical protein
MGLGYHRHNVIAEGECSLPDPTYVSLTVQTISMRRQPLPISFAI